MIYRQRGRQYYSIKFGFRGRLIHLRTRARNKKDALAIQAKVRSELERGNWGILEPKPAPALSEYLRHEFLPFTRSTFALRPATARYYSSGAAGLISSDFATLRLDQITSQHAAQYTARLVNLSPSTINCGLRTLRRALSLAVQWGKLDRMPKIPLAKGERQRERVLTDHEISSYLGTCEQPWRDAATIMLGTGCRPGEVFSLRWEQILLSASGGLIQIVQGKSRAARRLLPMVPAVYTALKTRWESQGHPQQGWVFPSASRCGHFEGGTAKGQHARALMKANEFAKKSKRPELKPFEPYCLRHTALTRLAEAGCDAFTLARIAGHSSITITQRYCHPQADAIEQAFQRLTSRPQMVTDGGHQAILTSNDERQLRSSD